MWCIRIFSWHKDSSYKIGLILSSEIVVSPLQPFGKRYSVLYNAAREENEFSKQPSLGDEE
jgi:hypothetical protein